MTAMIYADSSIKQAKVQGSVATQMEGRTRILEAEIKQDRARGNGTQKKEEELAETEQKAQAATSSQLSALADADKAMKEAAENDRKEETAGRKAEETDDKDEKAISAKERDDAETTTQQPTAYVPVDIRL